MSGSLFGPCVHDKRKYRSHGCCAAYDAPDRLNHTAGYPAVHLWRKDHGTRRHFQKTGRFILFPFWMDPGFSGNRYGRILHVLCGAIRFCAGDRDRDRFRYGADDDPRRLPCELFGNAGGSRRLYRRYHSTVDPICKLRGFNRGIDFRYV